MMEQVSVLALVLPEAGRRTPAGRVVLVGGVPGAGKSTVIAQLAAAAPEVDALDPDAYRRGLQRLLPGTAYAVYRPLVHTLHAVRVLLALLAGPAPGRTLVVHDPATRPRRRRLFARLALVRGWDPVLLYLDVPRRAAEIGQVRRGRVVDPVRFAGHWARGEVLRSELVAGPRGLDDALWSEVMLTDRQQAAHQLRRAALGARPELAVGAGERKRVWTR